MAVRTETAQANAAKRVSRNWANAACEPSRQVDDDRSQSARSVRQDAARGRRLRRAVSALVAWLIAGGNVLVFLAVMVGIGIAMRLRRSGTVGRWPHEPLDQAQALRGTGPVPGQASETGVSGDRAQHQRNHDGIVGVAQDRDEVWDEVDR